MQSPARISELSFSSMPELFVPLRFFLTAPLFGILASIVLLVYADSIFASRWTAEIFALTHLLTVGFMLMSMSGALFQFIPIISGFAIPNSKIISPFIHVFLTLGTLFLVAGFILVKAVFFQLAFILLFLSLIVFVCSLTYLLIWIENNKIIIFILRLADFALLTTLLLGLLMLSSYAFTATNISFREYTNMHMIWGLLVWTILLIMAVSSQIIPMFYVTPIFVEKYLKRLAIGLMSCLFVLTALELLSSLFLANEFISKELIEKGGIIYTIIELGISFLILFFSLYTLSIINQRKRKIKDMTINFWNLSLVMPMLAIILYWLSILNPVIVAENMSGKFELLIGILFIFGFAMSAIIGMMQKIVPFILVMHLQQKIMSVPHKIHLLPTMQALMSVKNQQIQFYLHLISLIFLIVSLFINALVIIAAIMMFVSFSWLTYQLYKSVEQYLQLNRAIQEG